MIPHALSIPDLYTGSGRIIAASFPAGLLFPAPVHEAHVARIVVEWPSGHVSGYRWTADRWYLEERIPGYPLSNARNLSQGGPAFRNRGVLSFSDPRVMAQPLTAPDWRPLDAWLRAASSWPRVLHCPNPLIASAAALRARTIARWLSRFGDLTPLEDGQRVRGLAHGSALAEDADTTGTILGPCDVDRLIVSLHMLGVIAPSHFAPTGREIVITSTEAKMMAAPRVSDKYGGAEGPDGRMYANWGNASWYWGRGTRWHELPAFGC
jgi:hypothetical protein